MTTNPANDIRNPVVYHDDVTFGAGFYPPAASISNEHISSNANERIAADKQVHRQIISHGQADGSNVTSETKLLHIARGAFTLADIDVRPTTAPTGGDLQYTIDVQKAANAAAVWTSLLDSVITVDATSVDDTSQTKTLIATPTLAAGEALRIVVTTSGSTGSQGQGFVCVLNCDEEPS